MATLREQIATTALTVTKFRELLRTMRANRPDDDLELVRKAYEFSQKHHAGQVRASGEPYLVHPLGVAQVLAEMKMDAGGHRRRLAARLGRGHLRHHC